MVQRRGRHSQPPPLPRYISKWHTLSAALVCQFAAGLGYSFSVYSDDVKRRFGYSQEQVQGIGSAANLGGYLSIISGLVYDSTTRLDRAGPRLTLSVGALLNCAGYAALWAAATGRMHPAYWQVVGIAMVGPLAGTFMDTSCLITCTRNFPTERGTVIGLIKAGIGLSASVFTSLYVGFLAPDAMAYLLFMAATPSAIILATLVFINHVPYVQECELHSNTGGRLRTAVLLVGLLGAYLLATAVLEGTLSLTRPFHIAMATGSLCIVACVLLLPVGMGGLWAVPAHMHCSGADAAEHAGWEEPLLRHSEDHAGDLKAGRPCSANEPALEAVLEDCVLHGRELSPLQCLRNTDFWLLFFACAAGKGTGLVYLNNLGQLVTALGGRSDPAVFVSIFSVFSCCGRLLFGYVPERLLHKRGLPRPLFLIGAGLLMSAVAAACAAAPYAAALYPAGVLSGLAFGGHWSLAPALASEWFGLRHFASNYCLLQLAPALGGFLLATKLAGGLYDREAAAQGAARQCSGGRCFRLAFLTCSALCLLAATASLALHLRTRRLYHVARQHSERPRS